MNILITGTNRGIGLELCRQYLARGETVFATCREPGEELQQIPVKLITDIDVSNDNIGAKLKEALADTPLDMIINNSGIMLSSQLSEPDMDALRTQFEINSLGPIRVVSALLDNLSNGGKIGIVTSRMGSIDDNTSGGSYGYRMSKVAANMAGRSMAHDLKPRQISVALLHPGWVRTKMTGYGGLIDADESAAGLIKVMDKLEPANSGQFWHTNGEILEW